jgi:hypothetical protein
MAYEDAPRQVALTETYVWLVRDVTALLAEHDPVGLSGMGAPVDEYEMEAGQIVRRVLREAKSSADAERIASEMFADYFGAEYGRGLAAAGRDGWQRHEKALADIPPPAFGHRPD